MKYKLYGIYCDDELVYIGKVEDTAEAMMHEIHRHAREVKAGKNDVYEYLAKQEKEWDYDIHIVPLNDVPNIDIEIARRVLVYTLRPFGNWHEWHWLEEQEEQQNIKTESEK